MDRSPDYLDENDVRSILADRVATAGSQAAYARQIGVSDEYVRRMLNGTRAPGPKVLGALGLREVVRYEMAR